jgi:hypothetical protein
MRDTYDLMDETRRRYPKVDCEQRPPELSVRVVLFQTLQWSRRSDAGALVGFRCVSSGFGRLSRRVVFLATLRLGRPITDERDGTPRGGHV